MRRSMAEEKMTPKAVPQTILWGLLVIAAFLVGSLYTKVQYLEKSPKAAGTTTPTTQAPAAPAPVTVTIDQIKNAYKGGVIKFGNEKGKLLLVEVADPSCPYCHVAAGKDGELNTQMGDRFTLVADGGTYVAPIPEMKKLVDSGKAAFLYLYTPGHGNGEMGTKALYCAYEKGKFWEAHDLLMNNAGYSLLNNVVKNDKAKSGELADFLKGAMDAGQLKSCLDSGKYDARLSEDIKIATSLGISGTPGFFINATEFAGAYSYADMESAVTAALK